MFTSLIARAPLGIVLCLFPIATATGQHQHEQPASRDTLKKSDTTHMSMPMPGMPADTARKPASMHHMGMSDMSMAMTGPLGISMDRMGSGTTWVPDGATLPAHHLMIGAWGVMAHGFVWGQYNRQGGPRGGSQFGSLNWGMLMADHAVGGGRIELRTMLSLDPLTVTAKGYPELLQTGESFRGAPLHDRQHPHDFFMELAALYEREVTPNLALQLYAAPSGEPALGPVAFMHRPSAMDEPMAPLSHHWQDATHVSFGVLTAGLFTRTVKVEASVFNGVEPDDSRWNVDFGPLNSYSARVTVNPNTDWSLSAGYGFLNKPEPLHPGESMRRLTASVLNGHRLGVHSQWASSLIWGANVHDGGHYSHSLLAEAEALFNDRQTVFGRIEWVQKTAEDLVLGAAFDPEHRFNVAAVSAGYVFEISHGRNHTLGIGARGTVNVVPSQLEPHYGSRTPMGGMIFVRFRPVHAPTHDLNGRMEEMK